MDDFNNQNWQNGNENQGNNYPAQPMSYNQNGIEGNQLNDNPYQGMNYQQPINNGYQGYDNYNQQPTYIQNNYYVNEHQSTSIENGKKKKKKKGCLWGLFKFFIGLIIFIIVILGLVKLISGFIENKRIEEMMTQIHTMSIEDYVNQTVDLEAESDIIGLTNKGKLEKGLSLAENSDTDGDGISDKEEIEKYNTDPKKVSSSGDSIPDGYKVEKGLDLNKKYSLEEAGFDVFNQYEEVEFKDKEADNVFVGVEIKDGYRFQGEPAIKTYRINSYNGKVVIDFTKDINGETSGFKSFLINDETDEIKELKLKNGKVEVKLNGYSYKICLVKSDVSLNSSFDMNLSSGSYTEMRGSKGTAVFFPITALTGTMQVIVVEEVLMDLNYPDRSLELSNTLTNLLNIEGVDFKVSVEHDYYDPISYKFFTGLVNTITSGKIVKDMVAEVDATVGEEELSIFRQIISFFIMSEEFENYGWLNEVFSESEDEVKEEVKPSKWISTFNVKYDAYSFPNLCTYISDGGNCAGFSQSVVQIFNGKGIKSSGDYTRSDGSNYKYNIDNDSELATLMDSGFYDYKNRNYWNSTYPNLSTTPKSALGESDGRFIEYIGYKWAECNDKVDTELLWYTEEEKWSKMEALMNFMESGDKVFNVCMISAYGGHSIVGYGIEQDANDPDKYYILVYDCNFPNHEMFDGKGNSYSAYNKIKIVKKNHIFGEPTFTWDYQPYKKLMPDYRFTSGFQSNFEGLRGWVGTLTNASSLSFCDENFNMIR